MSWPVHRFIALQVETRILRAGDMLGTHAEDVCYSVLNVVLA